MIGTIELKESKADSKSVLIYSIISGRIILVLAMLLGYFIIVKISRNLKILVRNIQKIGDRDLSVRSDVKSSDETGIVAREFNKIFYE